MHHARRTPQPRQEVAQSGAAAGRGEAANNTMSLPQAWRPAKFPERDLGVIDDLDHQFQVVARKQTRDGMEGWRWVYTFNATVECQTCEGEGTVARAHGVHKLVCLDCGGMGHRATETLRTLQDAMWAGAVVSHHMQAPDGSTALLARLARHQHDWRGVVASRRFWEAHSGLLRAKLNVTELGRLQQRVRARR